MIWLINYRKKGLNAAAGVILLICVTLSECIGQSIENVWVSRYSVDILHSWELPEPLKNIAAVRYLPGGKIACLSEDVGSIFIFNPGDNVIEAEFPFAQPGDYEGLEIIGQNAYVGCADGRILEIINYASDSPSVTEYGTHLTVRDHVNGLSYDRKNRRLLVSVQGMADELQPFKNIYGFRLQDKRMLVKPAVKIDLRNRCFNGAQAKRLQTVFQPSDLDLNPLNGQLYVIDGARCQLLRMRLTESIRDVIVLDKDKFFQPEGITITPSGEIYIASRGERDQAATLMLVRIKSK